LLLVAVSYKMNFTLPVQVIDVEVKELKYILLNKYSFVFGYSCVNVLIGVKMLTHIYNENWLMMPQPVGLHVSSPSYRYFIVILG